MNFKQSIMIYLPLRVEKRSRAFHLFSIPTCLPNCDAPQVVSSDSAREPWKVDLPAYSFTPGSSHQLKATASYGSGTVREHVPRMQNWPFFRAMVGHGGPWWTVVGQDRMLLLRSLVWKFQQHSLQSFASLGHMWSLRLVALHWMPDKNEAFNFL